jgi:hypothetical protein
VFLFIADDAASPTAYESHPSITFSSTHWVVYDIYLHGVLDFELKKKDIGRE